MKIGNSALIVVAASASLTAFTGSTGGGGGSLPGFMTGGGSIIDGDLRVFHGFHLNCTVTDGPQRLEANCGGSRFHLDQLDFARCTNDPTINPTINPGQPSTDFNTFTGSGTGSFDGVPGATISFTFTEAGEPGVNDSASYSIEDADGNPVLSASGFLDNGNQQAHK